MDATMLAVFGTGVALFAALWRVQGNRFDILERHMDKRFEASEALNRERFEMAERASQAPQGAGDEAGQHAAICDSIARLDERTRTDTAALHQRFDGLNGRFDDLYRHLLGAPAKTDLARPRPAPAAG